LRCWRRWPSVLLFLAAIISAFWYLRLEEIDRETRGGQARHRIAQQQMRLRLLERQEQLMRIARELVHPRARRQRLHAAGRRTGERPVPEITHACGWDRP
jgi:hypothetical protein